MIHKQIQQDKARHVKGLMLMMEEHGEKYFKLEIYETISYIINKVRDNPFSPHSQYALQEAYKTNLACIDRLNGFEYEKRINKGLMDDYLK